MQLFNTLSAEERAELIDQSGKQRLTLSFYAYAKIEDPKTISRRIIPGLEPTGGSGQDICSYRGY